MTWNDDFGTIITNKNELYIFSNEKIPNSNYGNKSLKYNNIKGIHKLDIKNVKKTKFTKNHLWIL